MTDAPTVTVTPLTLRTYEALAAPDGPRVIRHEGGTSSGKTRGIAHAWVRLLHERPGTLDVVRMSGPVLRDSVWQDITVALQESGLPFEYRAVDMEYHLEGGGIIKGLPLDGAKGRQKAHGRRRDYLWCNEANETPYGIFKQLRMRTRRRIVLDYNPAMEDDHYIFREYDASDNCVTFNSTFQDNPFLEDETLRDILLLKDTDPFAWSVYGKGERGVPAHRVFPFVEPLPESVWRSVLAQTNDLVAGWDFGFHDPTAIVVCARLDGVPRASLYVWCIFHDRLHTNGDVLAKLVSSDHPHVALPKGIPVWADSAESDRIEEIKRAKDATGTRYNARPVAKGKGSIKAGVDWLKRHTIYVGGPDGFGETARAEMKRYRNVERGGRLQDEPLDRDNHVADALRYAAFTHWGKPQAPNEHHSINF